jgi:hypothetical protein
MVAVSKPNAREKFKLTYRNKTETWVKSRAKIEALIKEVKKERKKEVPFNILGNRSIFSKPVEIFNIYDTTLLKLQKQNPVLFLHLCDSVENGGEPTGMSKENFDLAIAILDDISTCWNYTNLIQLIKTATIKLEEKQNNCFT